MIKQVPNINWMSLQEAKTHFNKLPDLVRVISTPMSSKLYCIVPRELIGYATGKESSMVIMLR